MNYSYCQSYTVSISDINYGGHVSNASVLNYFQEGRIGYLKQLGNFSEINIGSDTGMILAESNVKYLAEMFHGDRLDIHVKTTTLKRSSFIFEYQIFKKEVFTVSGHTQMVAFDYNKRKVTKIPDIFKKAIKEFEKN